MSRPALRASTRTPPDLPLEPMPERLVMKGEVLERTGLSFPTIWTMMRKGAFPRARVVGGKSAVAVLGGGCLDGGTSSPQAEGRRRMTRKQNKPKERPSATDVARAYVKRGWAPVPVPRRKKGPTNQGWQKLQITRDNVERYFGDLINVGVKLGRASGGLTDVDLDCSEAIALAPYLLPETHAKFGRKSKPGSHWLYLSDLCETEQRAVIKFTEPRALARGSEPATLVELRIGAGDKGAQTIFPGSAHPSGERVLWKYGERGEAARVDGNFLKRIAGFLAAGALLARHYSHDGARHDAALVLGGVLARGSGMDAHDIEHFVSTVARVAGDEEADERGRSAASAVDRLKRREPTPGLPRMREIWGAEVANTVARWLDLDTADAANDHHAGAKQADALITLALSANLFHTDDGKGYADIDVGGHRETWPIRSTGFREWLLRRYYTETGSSPNAEAMRTAIETIAAKARFDGPVHAVHVRVGGHDGKIYLDLADESWRAVEIDLQGWHVISAPPVRFRRHPGMLALPAPKQGGSVETLRSFINVEGDPESGSDPDFVLVVSWLLAALRDRGPYPGLALKGDEGSAKSTLVRVLRRLIDPSKVRERRLPREDRDLFIAAQNAYVVAFGNVSQIPDWLSDSLCSLATGGGFATRQLYTDSDEILFDAMRPVVLNGIEFGTRSDLADRLIFLKLPRIPERARRSEEEFWAGFDEERPAILGALLDVVVQGLKALPDVKLERLPRMADFARWATACETALWPPGTFKRAYERNRRGATYDVIEADPIAFALFTLMANVEKGAWSGTATELLDKLEVVVGEKEAKRKTWPTSAAALGARLRRLATRLRRLGIKFDYDREGHRSARVITIRRVSAKKGQTPSAPSALSAFPIKNAKTADNRPSKPSAMPSASNLLQNKGTNSADSADSNFRPVAEPRPCNVRHPLHRPLRKVEKSKLNGAGTPQSR